MTVYSKPRASELDHMEADEVATKLRNHDSESRHHSKHCLLAEIQTTND